MWRRAVGTYGTTYEGQMSFVFKIYSCGWIFFWFISVLTVKYLVMLGYHCYTCDPLNNIQLSFSGVLSLSLPVPVYRLYIFPFFTILPWIWTPLYCNRWIVLFPCFGFACSSDAVLRLLRHLLSSWFIDVLHLFVRYKCGQNECTKYYKLMPRFSGIDSRNIYKA